MKCNLQFLNRPLDHFSDWSVLKRIDAVFFYWYSFGEFLIFPINFYFITWRWGVVNVYKIMCLRALGRVLFGEVTYLSIYEKGISNCSYRTQTHFDEINEILPTFK